MTGDVLRERLARDRGDLSAEVAVGARDGDLDPLLVSKVRRRGDVSGQEEANRISGMGDAELLESVNLVAGDKITNAALVLLGRDTSLARLHPQAELIFEYRASPSSIEYRERDVYREGLLGRLDKAWNGINKRNEVQSFQFGLVRHQVRTFAGR